MEEKIEQLVNRFREMNKLNLKNLKERDASHHRVMCGYVPGRDSTLDFEDKLIILYDGENYIEDLKILEKKGFGGSLFVRNQYANFAWLTQEIGADLSLSYVHSQHEEFLLRPDYDLPEFLSYTSKYPNKGLVVFNNEYDGALNILEKSFCKEKIKIPGVHFVNFDRFHISKEERKEFQKRNIFCYY